jgi:hypothetical protein
MEQFVEDVVAVVSCLSTRVAWTAVRMDNDSIQCINIASRTISDEVLVMMSEIRNRVQV